MFFLYLKFFWLDYRIIRLYIDLYTKNPHVLDPLRQFIKLPSNKTIRKVAMSMSMFS